MKTMIRVSTRRLLVAITCLFVLASCKQSFNLQTQSDVPVPLVTQLPLNMGVYYKDEFRNYVYTENSEDRQNWSIDSGSSQVALFDQVLPSMFANTTQVNGLDASVGSNVDAILVPQVEEMQFSLPRETRSEFYEAWIKYKIALHDNKGDIIAEWPVTGYGKSSTEFLKSRDKGMLAAVNSAFRDIGAKLSLNFTKVNPIRQWLASKPEVCGSVNDLC